MANLLRGVIQVTGEHDTGKTTFALECGAPPSRILFFDDDLKGRATVGELRASGVEFGEYVDLIELAKDKNEYAFHAAVLERLSKVKKNQFDAIVWDTWTHFASTCHAFVRKHPDRFSNNWSPMGKIKGAQEWQHARRYEASLISLLETLAPTVILVTHLKDMYVGQVKVPGKQVPANSNALDRVLRLRLWLRRNPNGRPVPIALVLKRLDRKIVTEQGLRTINVLPQKLVPGEGEHSLWDTIWNYWERPMGDREPFPHETPDAHELSILGGTLTPDQLLTMRSIIDAGLGEPMPDTDLQEDVKPDYTADILRLQEEGRPLPLIAKELGISVAEVSRVLDVLPKEEEAA
jgi:hypothetical protein